MPQAALIDLHREIVQNTWVDYNGHMNVAYYVLVFDHATDALLDFAGLNRTHREKTQNSVMILKYPENKTNTGAKTKLYFLITSLS